MNKKTSPDATPVDAETNTTLPDSEAELPGNEATDPTSRWSERVREMSVERRQGYGQRKVVAKHGCNTSACPACSLDIHAIAECAQQHIVKRPLTSMVIAASAGAMTAALLVALLGGKSKR